MTDARVRRDYLEILERGLAPAQKCIALHVALEFQLGIQAESVGTPKTIDLNGMIDDQLGREERIDELWIPAHVLDGLAHGREIHHRWNAREILQQHARWHERDFFLSYPGRPGCQCANVVSPHETSVFATQEIFQQYAEGEGQFCQVGYALLLKCFQTVDFEGLCADMELVARAEGISRG